MAADVVAVDVSAEQPVDVGRCEADVLKRRKEILFRLKMRRVNEEFLLAAHEDDARPDGAERDAKQECVWQNLLEGGPLLEDLASGKVKVVGIRHRCIGVLGNKDARIRRNMDMVPDTCADVVVFERLHRHGFGLRADKQCRLASLQDECLVRGVVSFKGGEIPGVEPLRVVERGESPLRVVHEALVTFASVFNDVKSVHVASLCPCA